MFLNADIEISPSQLVDKLIEQCDEECLAEILSELFYNIGAVEAEDIAKSMWDYIKPSHKATIVANLELMLEVLKD